MATTFKNETFREEMLRKYTPYLKFNAFGIQDIKDIKNVIDYARGLVIKNEELAHSYETNQSMSTSDKYIRAKKGTDESTLDMEKRYILNNYKEYNKYYKGLYDVYNIDPYDSRMATDYQILKATNRTLDKWNEVLFLQAYDESLNYYLKVTRTKAFDNQVMRREFFQEIIAYMTIQRYINKQMEGYFNVDQYNKRQLKNAFISLGLDYFDSFPINYQRRILKRANDLIRNKGTNEVFSMISEIFSFDSVVIHKYSLSKWKDLDDKDDLIFFKTPIDQKLNIYTDKKQNYEKITQDDPYWRVEKKALLDKVFGVINTKYLSVDIVLDLVGNSKQMAYLWSLLNTIQIENDKLVEQYAKENNVTIEEAKKKVGLQGSDFTFLDRNISDQPIQIYDAFVTLIVLVLKRLNWKDTIHHHKGSLKRTYGYNYSSDVRPLIDAIRIYLIQHKHKFKNSKYSALINFINGFNLKGFDIDTVRNDNKYIMNKYNSSRIFEFQLQAIGELMTARNGSDNIQTALKDGRVYDAMEYLILETLDKDRKIDFDLIEPYTHYRELQRDIVDYLIVNKTITADQIYKRAFESDILKSELDQFIIGLDVLKLNDAYDIYKLAKTEANFKMVLDLIPESIGSAINDDKYPYRKQLLNYKNLSVFIENYLPTYSVVKDSYSMEDFANTFRYNENLRKDLENFIIETDDHNIYTLYKQLWEEKFVDDFKMDMFDGYKTFSEFLKDRDVNLYYYTIIENTDTNKYDPNYKYDVYRDRIFELATSIDNHLNMPEFDFILKNNFIGLVEFIKRYIYIMIRIFKAYTVETIYAMSVYTFDDKIDNAIRLFDDFDLGKSKLYFKDIVSLLDTYDMNSFLGYTEDITTKDEIKINTKSE